MERTFPHSKEMEREVLGSILIDPEAMVKVSDFLKPEHFYNSAHRDIYEAIRTLHLQHTPADYELLTELLGRDGKLEQVGGLTYILGLVENIPTSGNALHYGRVVEKKARFRAVLAACGHLAGMAYEEDESVFSQAEERFFKIGQGATGNAVISHNAALDGYWQRLEALHQQQSNGVLTGIPTGYPRLNAKLGGLRPAKSYILAGRPGDGKTALALNIAYHAMKSGCQVLFFSIEMDDDELMQRLIAMEAGIDSQKLRDVRLDTIGEDGRSDWERVVDATDRLQAMTGKIWLDDTPANSIDAMRSKARQAKSMHGIELIMVDYLQLAEVEQNARKVENRRLEVEEVSRKLKGLSRELNVPVFSLAQMSREVESRAGRVPQLSDLRESGAIEADADVVMFIHKDPVISKDASEYEISLIIEKNRTGPKGIVPLRYVGWQTKFYPVDGRLEEKL